MRLSIQSLVNIAIELQHSLSADILGRHFSLSAHPRLESIARAGNAVHVPVDSPLLTLYDGLISEHDELKVHASIGLPLFTDQQQIGALTSRLKSSMTFSRGTERPSES